MESLLSSSSAWSLKYKDVGGVDDSRIPECAEGFMTLLSVITGVEYNQDAFFIVGLNICNLFGTRELTLDRK